jgi:GT2 family glycosyltransferase
MTQSMTNRTVSETRPLALFAVIPVHNHVDQTLRCLAALATSTVGITAIVVDDGSSDDTRRAVAIHHPDATVLRGDGTLWWAGAVNLGAAHAMDRGADYILTLNNDGVLAPTALEALLAAEDRGRPALRCSQRRHLDHPENLHDAGLLIDWTLPRGYRRQAGGSDQPVLVDMTGANAMLIPRRCFEDIGLFDAARFPQCWADWDFQLRAKAKGWPLYTVPASVLFEDRSTLGPRRTQQMTLGDALRLVASRRSPYFPPFTWRFYRRHAPASRVLGLVFRRYEQLAESVLRYHLRPC